jgi:hypothetical protein
MAMTIKRDAGTAFFVNESKQSMVLTVNLS